MTQQEAYDEACRRWGDGCAIRLGGMCVVGKWTTIGEIDYTSYVILRSATKAVEVMGLGKTWHAALGAWRRSVSGGATAEKRVNRKK